MNDNIIEHETNHDIPDHSNSDELLADIDAIDREIIRLRIANPKITLTELGKRFKLARHTIAKRLQKEKVQRALDQLQKNALDTLLDAQSEAARRLIMHMRSNDQDVSLKACKEILTGVLEKAYKLSGDVNLLVEIVNAGTGKK